MQKPGFSEFLYEKDNHLANVHVVVSDRKQPHYTGSEIDYFTPDIKSVTDYYPFGMQMPGRSYQSGSYRFGFNGKEYDSEWNGTASIYDYGFRIYNAQIARFLSVDPLFKSYPWYTPYQFAGNNPIWAIDLDGLEEDIQVGKVPEVKPMIERYHIDKVLKQIEITKDVINQLYTAIESELPENTKEQYAKEGISECIKVDVAFEKQKKFNSEKVEPVLKQIQVTIFMEDEKVDHSEINNVLKETGKMLFKVVRKKTPNPYMELAKLLLKGKEAGKGSSLSEREQARKESDKSFTKKALKNFIKKKITKEENKTTSSN